MVLKIISCHETNSLGVPYTSLCIYIDSPVSLEEEPVCRICLPDHREMCKTQLELYGKEDDDFHGVCQLLVDIQPSEIKELLIESE